MWGRNRSKEGRIVFLALIGFFPIGLFSQVGLDSLPEQEAFDTIPTFIKESAEYLSNRDLDGDGEADQLHFSYSGGAHCCYSLSITVSSLDKPIDFPFEMDGGYVFGIPDGSQPSQFRIEDVDEDGRDEILMWIGTYNGVEYDLPRSWRRGWAFKTHRIVIEVEEGKIVVRDQREKEIWKQD